VIHVKDLVEAVLDQREAASADVARPPGRVAESSLLTELMRDLRRQRQQIRETIELDSYNVEACGVDEARITRLRFGPRQP
jgi:Mg2+/Co2+ transporter CorC